MDKREIAKCLNFLLATSVIMIKMLLLILWLIIFVVMIIVIMVSHSFA